jgi:hypothetical protein
MTLAEEVEKLVDQLAKEDANRDRALEDAEALADRYKDIKPKTYAVPMEKFLGFPAFSK